MTSTTSSSPPSMPPQDDVKMDETTALKTESPTNHAGSGSSSFLPTAPHSPHRAPAWNSAPNTPAGMARMHSPPHPPLSPSAAGGRHHHHPHAAFQPSNHHHNPQRPLSTYTTFGSPRTTTRVRSASLGNAPYQQKVLPSIGANGLPTTAGALGGLVGNPQGASGNNMFLPLGANANPQPPEISQERKAMEAAAAAERTRAKELEAQESDMSADELRAVLKKERHRTAKIQADLAALRSGTVQQQFQAEVLEEGRINGLLTRMDDLQEEKGRIILELEREEEMLTNTLQKKLNEVRREKNLLEQRIDKEKKANAALQMELTGIRSNNLMATAEKLEEEDEMEEED